MNLDIEVLNFLGSITYQYKNGEINLIAYKARAISGSMKLNVHNDAKWVSVTELKNFDFAPADVELIKIIAPASFKLD